MPSVSIRAGAVQHFQSRMSFSIPVRFRIHSGDNASVPHVSHATKPAAGASVEPQTMRPNKPDNRSQLILLEQVRAAYRATYSVVAAHLLAAVLLIMALSGSLTHWQIVLWPLAVAAVLGIYILWHRKFVASGAIPDEAAMWASRRTWIGLALGALWGYAGSAFFPSGDIASQALITMLLVGIGAGALTSSASYLPANYSIVIAMLVPLIVRTAIEADTLHAITALLLTIYLGFILFGARVINRVLVESLTTRFENIDLIDALTRQKQDAERARLEAEKANLELKHEKAAAEQARLAAEAANEAKSRFLAAASHDLRQPLHALGLFAGVLVERIQYPEVRNIVTKINASVEALEALFNALLDISKLDAGVIDVTPCTFPVQTLLDRLGNEFTVRAREKGLALRIPPCRYAIHTDPTLLERILRNLVSNAVQYTNNGGVLVACRKRGKRLLIQVIDTGIGIPADEQQRVFEEFYQIGNPERDRAKGLGLGLAIVKRLALLLSSPLALKSAPGRGSSLSISVPLGSAVAPRTGVEPGAWRGRNFDGKSVLIVDDEVAVRESVQILLEVWGCDVAAAGSVEEALELTRDTPPDLILADYRLRGHSTGIQAIQRVQEQHGAQIPAVLITGDTDPGRLREAKASGFQLLHKPVAPPQLRALLTEFFEEGEHERR